MALTTKRIIALPSQTDPQEGDYLAIDNLQGGTHKIPVGRVGVEVDDTLTEQGKAADAKATGDAIDEIRSQIEVTGTASGAIATFTDGSDNPMKSCMVTIEPQQSGTGTPSPDNVRPISGWDSVSVTDSGKNLFDKDNAQVINAYIANGVINSGSAFKSIYIPCKPNTTYTISAGTYTRPAGLLYTDELPAVGVSAYGDATTKTVTTGANAMYLVAYVYNSNTDPHTLQDVVNAIQIEASTTATAYEPYTGTTITTSLGRTVYGGTLDVVSGVLTAYPFYPSYNGETLDGRWICDRAVYAEGTTPPTGSQVALISGTSTTYQLTPTEVNTLLGDNNVWADSGDVEVVYVRNLNITINNLLNSNGTRSLGMMMSAPTEAPTDEQTEEPAEDDMR